ncbi:M16 family metallopeptidase [Zunongwangia sp. HRR-M8]|uniref:M16 family metallopeptidase n=1 Tax=Zunongwangia sp. HRR-M8 TaxID=3015170 RepID=UPI0022DCFA47|nr:insulinase family protein [Zunongwangia sp. HRR-M8]WBL22326.1 insulinase family protein [Zunongwangia sp. HRR-M8]
MFLFICLIAFRSSPAQTNEHIAQELIPLDSTVRYGRLDNGFTYYLRKNNFPEKTIELQLIVKAGRIHRDEDQLEYAHLLEHLLAKETQSFKNIRKHFRDLGGISGAETGHPFTSYDLSIPSSTSQNLKDGVKVLREWSQGQSWSQESISVERAAVLGEMRNSDPYRRWRSYIIEREVLGGYGYKIIPRTKFRENIEDFKPKALKRYYKDWYRPDLQAAIIVGDINLDSMENLVKHRFSDLKMPKKPKNEQVYLDKFTVSFDGKNKFSTVIDSLHPGLKIEIIRSRPNFGFSAKTIEDYRMMLLQQIYDILLSEKLKPLQNQYEPPFEKFEPNYRSNLLPGNQVNATLMRLDLKGGSAENLKDRFQRGIISWKQLHLNFRIEALEEAKLQLKEKYQKDRFITSHSLANKYAHHFIRDKAAPNPQVEYTLVSKILSQISLNDMKNYSQEYATLKENTNFIFLKGEKETIPELQLFKEWIEEVDSMNIEPLKPPKSAITSLSEVAKIPSIDITEKLSVKENSIEVSTVLLPNNIKLVLKPTNPQDNYFENTVELKAFRPNPAPQNNRQKYQAVATVPEVLQYSGAGPYTKFQIDEYMRDNGLQLRLSTNMKNQLISGKAKIKDLPELLNLLYLYLNKPRQDEKAFKAFKKDQLVNLEGRSIRGSSQFIMDKIKAICYPEIPVLGINDLEVLRMDEVFEAASSYFSDLSGFTFVITGDFSKDELLPVLANTLGAFPTQPKVIHTDNKLDYPFKRMTEKLYFKNTNQVYTKLYFPIKIPEDTKTQVELQLLSKALNQRIFARLRDGCYAPSARGIWMDRANGIYAFEITFDSELGDEQRMLNNAKEEFKKLRDKGVDKEWLEKAIVNELRIYENRFNRFGYFNFWPDYLQQKLENSENLEKELLEYGTLLEHFISLEDINKAAKKFMNVAKLQLFQAYPEGYQDLK